MPKAEPAVDPVENNGRPRTMVEDGILQSSTLSLTFVRAQRSFANSPEKTIHIDSEPRHGGYCFRVRPVLSRTEQECGRQRSENREDEIAEGYIPENSEIYDDKHDRGKSSYKPIAVRTADPSIPPEIAPLADKTSEIYRKSCHRKRVPITQWSAFICLMVCCGPFDRLRVWAFFGDERIPWQRENIAVEEFLDSCRASPKILLKAIEEERVEKRSAESPKRRMDVKPGRDFNCDGPEHGQGHSENDLRRDKPFRSLIEPSLCGESA
jgi:hypothetical protein